jgi:CRP-like cAMP-binding protein
VYLKENASRNFYMVLEGVVQMYCGFENQFPCMVYEPGSFFGEIELMMNCPRQFTCIALTKCVLLTISKKYFFKLFFNKFSDFNEIFKAIVPVRIKAINRILKYIDNRLMEVCQKINPKQRKSIMDGIIIINYI